MNRSSCSDTQPTALLVVIFFYSILLFFVVRCARAQDTANKLTLTGEKKTSARLESCMQMRTNEGVPEFHCEAFRCVFPRCGNESLLRYAQLFDSNSISKFVISLSKILRPSGISKSRKVGKAKTESSQTIPNYLKPKLFCNRIFCILNSI